MHFVCSTFGSAGDVFPLLGLAIELKARGHEVTFATNEHFSELVRARGIRFEALGKAEEFLASLESPNLWHPRRAFRQVFEFLSPALRDQYELYARFAGTAGVVGITNCLGFGALLAQEKLRVPVITLHLQPAVLWSRHAPPTLPGVFGPRWLKTLLFGLGERLVLDPVTCPFLNAWRADLGLPPIQQITRWWNSPAGVLCMFPEWYAPPQPDWPARLVQTDFPLWNRPAGEVEDDATERFLDGGDPPIVFTPGSANIHGRDFFEAAVSACRALGHRGILLTEFPEQVPLPLPDFVTHVRYAPLDMVLPRARAFVHHGGIGSTSQAMLAGIPQVIVPLAHDQFDNAARVRGLGLGNSVSCTGLRGQKLAAVLGPLLQAANVAEACQSVARRLAPRGGLRQSASWLEVWGARATAMPSR